MATNNATKLINTGVLYTDRRKMYLNENRMAEVFANVNVFTAFSKKLKMIKTPDPDFKIFDYGNDYWNPTGTFVIGGSQTMATANTLAALLTGIVTVGTVVTGETEVAGTNFQPGMKLNVYRTSDKTFIFQGVVQSSTTILPTYVAKGFWSATTDVQNLGCTYYVIGDSQPENGLSQTPWSDEMSVLWNSCGINKTPLAISGTMLAAALRGETNELKWLRAKKFREHTIKNEKDYIWSRRIGGFVAAPAGTYGHHTDGNESGSVIRTTHGVLSCIEDWGSTDSSSSTPNGGYRDGTNVINMNVGSYGWNAFKNDMKRVFKFSNENGVKYAFCGDEFLSFMNDLTSGPMGGLTGRVMINQDIKASERFGFAVKAFETPFGVLKLVRSPLMTLSEGGLYSGTAIIIDPEYCGHVTYRPSKYETAIQENDRDGIKDQYFSDSGIWLGTLKAHFAMKMSSIPAA